MQKQFSTLVIRKRRNYKLELIVTLTLTLIVTLTLTITNLIKQNKSN